MTTNQFGGDWTSIKLNEILRPYLDAYTTALKNTKFELHYIDGFAGSGNWIPADSTSLHPLPGSPKLALSITDRSFDVFHFIDKKAKNAQSLHTLKKANPSRKIHIHQNDANLIIPKICESFGSNMRAVVFLDPFGMQLKWETITKIAATKKMDCWILCPTEAIQRNLPKKRLPDNSNAIRLDTLFGGRNHWKDLYEIRGLFDPTDIIRLPNKQSAIMHAYHNRLKEVFHTVSQDAYPLIGTHNEIKFHFMFAAGNEKGGPIANKIARHLIQKQMPSLF